jgi:hypothetical protein
MKMPMTPVDAGDDLLKDKVVRSRRRRITKADLKGMVSELRCMHVLKELVRSTGWIRKVRLSGYQDDKRGIDIIAHVKSGDKTIKVPIQVKSSAWFAQHWVREHPEFGAARAPLLIVDQYPDDITLKLKLFLELERVRDGGIEFRHLFHSEKRGVGNERKGRRPRYGERNTQFRNLVKKYRLSSDEA